MNEILTFQRAAPSSGLASSLLYDEQEAARLTALNAYEILDSAPEKSYDDLALLAAFICGAPVALISFFDRDRQWIKACFSTSHSFSDKTRQLARSSAFCDLTIQNPAPLILVPDMTQDEHFSDHPLVAGPARLKFYAAVPLVSPTGAVLGSLGVLDRKARALSPAQTSALETLARQVTELLKMRGTVIGLSQANARLGQQNYTDALTSVSNRRAYDQKISEEFARSRRTGTPLCLLMIDIDRFKDYNDTFGHPAGDTALESVARVLLASLRPYDFLARYGGEEFVIILPATGRADACMVAERVRRLVAESEFPHRKFTISIGVAELAPQQGVKSLLQAADNALYEAKAKGRNQVVASQPEAILAAG